MTDGLLLIAHGTRNPRGAQEMDLLVGHVRKRLDGPVAHAWIEEFADPDAVTAAGKLVAAGATRLVALPLLVLRAGHARYDVPRLAEDVRRSYPDALVAVGEVLGIQEPLLALAAARIEAACPPEQRDAAALLVTGSGSSDADANSDLAKITRLLAERTGLRWADVAFAGVTWPTADTALRRMAAAGAGLVVRFSWSLLAGVLERRVADAAARVATETGMTILDAGRFGPDPLVAEAVAVRYHQALGQAVSPGAVRTGRDRAE